MSEQTIYEALEATTEAAKVSADPLCDRLQVIARKVRELSPGYAEAVARLIERIAHGDVGQGAPAPGERMPAFILPDETGRLVSLDSLLGRGPLVVAFNRGHWCPYCRVHVDALARLEPDISALGAGIVAISPETAAFTARMRSEAKAAFPLLTDLDAGYALELGLLFWVGDDVRAQMAAVGVDLTAYQGNGAWMLPVPATFVLDSGGVVRARHVDPDYRFRMELDELLAAVRAVASQAA